MQQAVRNEELVLEAAMSIMSGWQIIIDDGNLSVGECTTQQGSSSDSGSQPGEYLT